jgi:hypothetical protein
MHMVPVLVRTPYTHISSSFSSPKFPKADSGLIVADTLLEKTMQFANAICCFGRDPQWKLKAGSKQVYGGSRYTRQPVHDLPRPIRCRFASLPGPPSSQGPASSSRYVDYLYHAIKFMRQWNALDRVPNGRKLKSEYLCFVTSTSTTLKTSSNSKNRKRMARATPSQP